MARFSNKVVVVTGGASGIGAATVQRFLDEEASVVVADANPTTLEAMDQRLQSSGASYQAVLTDVSDPASVEHLKAATLQAYGRVDALVANAGVWSQHPFLDLSLHEWDRIIGINLRGAFIVSQCFGRQMARQASGGAIVMTASTNSFVAEPNTAHYNASKGGLVMLVKSMAVDLAAFGIRVNAIAPGTIRTPLTAGLLDAAGEAAQFAFPPARRWGTPDECAAVIAFLASEEASYVTGEVVVVDGGQIALNGVVTDPGEPFGS